jgi:glucokinase
LRQGDDLAAKILADTMDDLSFGLSHAVHLFHPNTIIIGGGLSLIGEQLRANIEVRIKKYIMDAFQPGPLVQLSKLGENVVPMGAAVLGMRTRKKTI